MKLGIVVPSYMDVNSIEDLSDQARKGITGVEPGTGVVAVVKRTKETYPNLKD